MLRKFSARRIAFLFAIDWLGTLVMLLLAAFLRREFGNLPASLLDLTRAAEITLGSAQSSAAANTIFSLSPQIILLVALVWPMLFVVVGVYDGRRNDTLRAELGNVFLAICTSTLVLAGALYFTYRETSRLAIVLFFALDVALLLGSRVALWGYRRSQNGRKRAQHRAVLVVGAGPVGQNAVAELKKYAWADLDLIGYADDDPTKQEARFEGIPVLGILEQIPALVRTHRIDAALVALPLRAHERLLWTCNALQDMGVRVHIIPDLFALSFPSATLDGFGGIPVIDLGQPGLYGWRRLSKRAFDVVTATLLLILLSPLLLLIAFLIKIESSGPIIFRQERIGENGRPFIFLKFRSMQVNTDVAVHREHVARLIRENLDAEQLEEEGKSSLKMEDDPRITRVGRIIRKTSLDELPQLFNVLRGEMSLVGPRPPLPYEVELYEAWHKRRFEALPGITGWWQVKGRNRVSFDEMVRMDIYYIEQSSFWLDLRILLMTPWAVLSGRGAG